MARKADQIAILVTRYIAELERNKIAIRKAIIFGSYAKGDAKKESDIDVALVSEAFSGDRFEDRRKIISLLLPLFPSLWHSHLLPTGKAISARTFPCGTRGSQDMVATRPYCLGRHAQAKTRDAPKSFRFRGPEVN